ncbi:hypothetical protein CN941_30680 [Bacillus cereus]|uniref:Uncharacterized protein n=1 Tax=Bacillus cereus TaxID=1396 RepID=A0A2B0T8R9_BACCE|nr:recombinase family protein [Bacillus cereus]PEU05269.1 hypothetical protein CN527_02050 [Bacillus cereus]PFA32061.1 hypothetical protein CN390_17135 [Bacillus cereus]PFE59447.1 hypothetical protein CN316_28180 [Bacillus cereus]PFL15919.1 hypothetical protein COJ07_25905 [Bacillus cereus]PFU39493.1 hypothetical protein COK86_22085 [Bacillus cereus]
MNYAYIRVSTPQQDYTFQKKEILTYCEANKIGLLEECIFEEKQSGKNMERAIPNSYAATTSRGHTYCL